MTSRELIYPTYLLDLMVICWAQQPRHRPTASQIVSIASAPEFLHLMDVVSLDQGSCSSGTFAGKNNKMWMSLSSGFTDKSQLHVLDLIPGIDKIFLMKIETFSKSTKKFRNFFKF